MFNQEDYLKCAVCGYDYTHLEKIITFEDDDYNRLTTYCLGDRGKIKMNRAIYYPYRSQGNVQLLFYCEEQHYFYKGLDGHKGNISIDQNPPQLSM